MQQRSRKRENYKQRDRDKITKTKPKNLGKKKYQVKFQVKERV